LALGVSSGEQRYWQAPKDKGTQDDYSNGAGVGLEADAPPDDARVHGNGLERVRLVYVFRPYRNHPTDSICKHHSRIGYRSLRCLDGKRK
jgi:hypothetical protein